MLKLTDKGTQLYEITQNMSKDEMIAFISIAINKYIDKIKLNIIKSLRAKGLIEGE